MPDSRVLGVTWSLVYFDSLPVIATEYALEGFKKIKFSFYIIPCIIPGKIKVKDAIVNVGCEFYSSIVCVSSNYVAVIGNIWQEDAPRSWISRLSSQNEMQNQPRYQKLMVLLEVEH